MTSSPTGSANGSRNTSTRSDHRRSFVIDSTDVDQRDEAGPVLATKGAALGIDPQTIPGISAFAGRLQRSGQAPC